MTPQEHDSFTSIIKENVRLRAALIGMVVTFGLDAQTPIEQKTLKTAEDALV